MANIKISPVGFIVIFLLVGALVLYFERSWSAGGDQVSEDTDTEKIRLQELLSASIELAERGGAQVIQVMKEKKLNEKSKGETREGANNPVTDGDMRSHEAVMHGFQVTFPESLLVVSEEHEEKEWDRSKVAPANKHSPDVKEVIGTNKDETPVKDITVWLDPLDATQEYTEELLQYVTVMVCVAVNGKPTIGVIHKPFATEEDGDRMSWAWVGKGHSSNLSKPVKKATSLTDPKIIVSRSHSGTVKEVAKESFGEKTEVIPAGGAGYKTLALFQGIADAYIHTTLIKKWDICAGNAILNAFQGTMTTLEGNSINYDGHGSQDHNPKNEGGLLATLWEPEAYREKLAPVLKAEKHR